MNTDIGNRWETKAGGDANGMNLRAASYSPNLLNQYGQRTVPGAVEIMGVALAASPVTVNGQTACRKGEYFRKELTLNNASGPVWQAVTVSAPGQASVSGNILVPKTPEQFTYDADGNLLSDGQWNYVWDGENRLVGMAARTPIGPQISLQFDYDWQGRRIRKQVWGNTTWSGSPTNDLRFVYDGWNLIAELDALASAPALTLRRSYTWGLDLSGTLQGAGGVGGLLWVSEASGQPSTHFAAYDGNSNVAALVNAQDSTISARYEYGPFGEVIRATGSMAKVNPIGWSAKYTDDETDLLMYPARLYSPSTGRWLSSDPIEEQGGRSLYAFARNQPISRIDPDGRADIETPTICPKCGQSVNPVNGACGCQPPPNAQYPEGFAMCQRDVAEDDKSDVVGKCCNMFGGQHTYLQYVNTPQAPFQGPPFVWGWGFSGGTRTTVEEHFDPSKCTSCKKNGNSLKPVFYSLGPVLKNFCEFPRIPACYLGAISKCSGKFS